MGKKRNKAYENVNDRSRCCGIWCGTCAIGNGTLQNLTKKYQDLTAAYGLKQWALKGLNYEEFSRGLTLLKNFPPCHGCLKGGGRDECETKTCALEKDIPDCTLCNQFGACEHKKLINSMRSVSDAAGLFVKKPGTDNKKLIQDWSTRLQQKWPCSILFK